MLRDFAVFRCFMTILIMVVSDAAVAQSQVIIGVAVSFYLFTYVCVEGCF